MSKSKKNKSPKIDPRVLTRPRLDALFERHARGEQDLNGLEAGVRALIAEAGPGPVLEALVKRLAHAHPEALVVEERKGSALNVAKSTAGGSVDLF